MCGIVYKQSFNGVPVNQAIRQMYKNQRSRGTDGFGFYIPSMNRLAHNTREKRILGLLENPDYKATEILFHHRWPTSTSNVQNACHPFSTLSNSKHFDKNYVLVHNGVVSNASTLKTRHEALGIKYISEQPDGRFNDSEALLYDVALYLEKKQDSITAEGSIAFIVIDSDDTLRFARNYGSPLIYSLTSRGLSVSSEGKGVSIEPHKLYQFNNNHKSFITTDCKIPSYSYSTGSGYTTDYDDDDYEYIPDSKYTSYLTDTAIRTDAYDLIDSLGNIDDAIEFSTQMAIEYDELTAKLSNGIVEFGITDSASQDYDDAVDQADQAWALVQELWRLTDIHDQVRLLEAENGLGD